MGIKKWALDLLDWSSAMLVAALFKYILIPAAWLMECGMEKCGYTDRDIIAMVNHFILTTHTKSDWYEEASVANGFYSTTMLAASDDEKQKVENKAAEILGLKTKYVSLHPLDENEIGGKKLYQLAIVIPFTDRHACRSAMLDAGNKMVNLLDEHNAVNFLEGQFKDYEDLEDYVEGTLKEDLVENWKIISEAIARDYEDYEVEKKPKQAPENEGKWQKFLNLFSHKAQNHKPPPPQGPSR